MSRLSKGIVRLISVAAVVIAFQPRPPAVLAGEAGRELSRCVRACNTIRAACGDRCQDNCFAMFPDSKTQKEQRLACVDACKEICAEESADCKLVCNANRPVTGEDPSEP